MLWFSVRFYVYVLDSEDRDRRFMNPIDDHFLIQLPLESEQISLPDVGRAKIACSMSDGDAINE